MDCGALTAAFTMEPKFTFSGLLFYCGDTRKNELNRLKISARNCSLNRSVITVVLFSDVSIMKVPCSRMFC